MDTNIEIEYLDLSQTCDFAAAIRIIREKGESLGNDKWWYKDCFLFMDPADAGYSAMIVQGVTIYNGAWHLLCADGRREDWDIETYGTGWDADGRRIEAIDYKNAAKNEKDKNEQAAVPTVEVPTDVIDNIIKYCETQAVYDKLGRYGDFYYKLKNLRK